MRFKFAMTVLLSLIIGLTVGNTDTRAQDRAASEYRSSLIVSLLSDRQNYLAGDDVRIQVRLRNASPYPLSLLFLEPWYDMRLHVTDANGEELRPSSVHNPGFSGSLHPRTIPPNHEILAWKYVAPIPDTSATSKLIGADGFVTTKAWGYTFDKPGIYKIVAERILGDSVSMPSNSIMITIQPKKNS